MSTRSQVIMETKNGFIGTYIHCDGYPTCRGIECLGAKHAGRFMDFIRKHWYDEDYRYDYKNVDEIVIHARHSDLEYIYILMRDGTWTVLDISFACTKDYSSFENNIKILTGDDDWLCSYIAEYANRSLEWVDAEVNSEVNSWNNY